MSAVEYRTVLLVEVDEGAMLALDVLNEDGQILLCRGALLTPKLQQMLIQRGHTAIDILEQQPNLTEEQLREQLDAMFESQPSTPCMLELRGLFERFHARKASNE